MNMIKTSPHPKMNIIKSTWLKRQLSLATSRLVKQIFSVPATSAPIKRVFSQGGKILTPLRNRLKPKNLETLIFLKINSQYM